MRLLALIFITVACYVFSRASATMYFASNGPTAWTGGLDCACGNITTPCAIPSSLITTNVTGCTLIILPGQFSNQLLQATSTAGTISAMTAGDVLNLDLQLSGTSSTVGGVSQDKWVGNINFTSTSMPTMFYNLDLSGSSILLKSAPGLSVQNCVMVSPPGSNATLFQSASSTGGWSSLSVLSSNINANGGIMFDTAKVTGTTSVNIMDSNLSAFNVLLTYNLASVVVRRSTIQTTGRIFNTTGVSGPPTILVDSCTLSSPTLNNIYYGTTSSRTALTIFNTTMTRTNLATSGTTSSANYTSNSCTDCVIDSTPKIGFTNMTITRATNGRGMQTDLIIQHQRDLNATFTMITTATVDTQGCLILNTTFTPQSSFITRDVRFGNDVVIPGAWFNNGTITSTATLNTSVISSSTSRWTFTASTATTVSFYMNRGGILIFVPSTSPSTQKFSTTALFALPPTLQIQWDPSIIGMPVASKNYTLLTAASLTGSAPTIIPWDGGSTTLSFETFLSSDGKSLLYQYIPSAPVPVTVVCPPPAPGPDFECSNGVWVSTVSITQPTLTVPPGGKVQVEGNLTVETTITFQGVTSELKVNGCIIVGGKGVVVTLTKEELDQLAKEGSQSRRLLYSTSGNDCADSTDLSSVAVTTSTPGGCRHVKTVTSGDRASLNAIFSIDRSRCDIAIIVPSVVGGVIVIAVIVIIVVILAKKPCSKLERSSTRKTA